MFLVLLCTHTHCTRWYLGAKTSIERFKQKKKQQHRNQQQQKQQQMPRKKSGQNFCKLNTVFAPVNYLTLIENFTLEIRSNSCTPLQNYFVVWSKYLKCFAVPNPLIPADWAFECLNIWLLDENNTQNWLDLKSIHTAKFWFWFDGRATKRVYCACSDLAFVLALWKFFTSIKRTAYARCFRLFHIQTISATQTHAHTHDIVSVLYDIHPIGHDNFSSMRR